MQACPPGAAHHSQQQYKSHLCDAAMPVIAAWILMVIHGRKMHEMHMPAAHQGWQSTVMSVQKSMILQN